MIGVDEIETDRMVPDLHLSGLWGLKIGIDPLQDFGASGSRKPDCLHAIRSSHMPASAMTRRS